MTDLIIGLIVVAVIGAAVVYIIKEKKKGTKCIGCPAAGQCANHGKSGGCSCGCGDSER
ncbi:FeoB-associated Cys-rich membrane protein [Klebsiella pneumoniae]|uniref:FeoB-associated Cys-rich membrane protein n=1 Tax=Klebsiella pneumoniae TaxID=573 RepID=UPI0025A04630|nr:FeoB-associated Cys-rich membrane protein [Klebsiella pneumoniae]